MTEQELTKIKMAWAQGETVQYLTKGWNARALLSFTEQEQ